MKRTLAGDAKAKQTPASLLTLEKDKTYDIAQLASEFDVTFRTIRLYEEKGLLHPRRNGHTRIFTENDRQRLKLILDAKQMGFSLLQIANLLPKKAHGELVLALDASTVREQIDQLEFQRDEIAKGLQSLSRLYEELNEGIAKISAKPGTQRKAKA